MPILILPFSEQQKIVNFLDYKTGECDRFIANRQKQIELLNEQKAAIINKAVTKGINPNAKMKPSGIEWIGDIPKHWGCTNLKRLTRLAYGDSLSDENRNGGDVPVYGSNGIVGFHDKAITKSPCIIIGRKDISKIVTLCGKRT